MVDRTPSFKQKEGWLTRFLNRFKTPTGAMFHAWLFWLILYVFTPFQYTNTISLTTIAFICICLAAFAIGDTFALHRYSLRSQIRAAHNQKKSDRHNTKKRNNEQKLSLETLVRYFAIVGILGAIIVVVSKLLLSGLDFAAGVTGARIERASDIFSGQAASTPIWVYPGMLAFPFGSCAFLISLLRGEALSGGTRQLCKLAAISPIAVAVINGGRGGIFYFIVMSLGAFVLRTYDKSILVLLKLKIHRFVLLCISGFLSYNVYVFESRREVTAKEDFLSSLNNWEYNYGISPSKWSMELLQSGYIDASFLLNWMQTHFYFTSGPSILSRIIDSGRSLGPFFGQVQVAMLAPLLDKTIPSLSLSERVLSETNQIDVTGLIPSAWGMIFMDFGWFGAPVEAFILGAIARQIYSSALLESDNLGSKLMFCFVFASIVLSPIVAPLGFSDICFTFFSLTIACYLLNKVDLHSNFNEKKDEI